jgi:hypothetical protein
MTASHRSAGVSRPLAASLVASAAVLWWAGAAAGGEWRLDTGRVRVVVGRSGGGFTDEAFLDLNGDGQYAADERVALRPEGEAGEIRPHWPRSSP